MRPPSAKDVGPGWEKIVTPLIEYCNKHGVEILQIKEKFSSLRFYYRRHANEIGLMGDPDPVLDKLITVAEEECEKTCEWCGDGGTKTKGGWIKTLCPEHTERYMNGERWWLTPSGHGVEECEPMPHYSHVCKRGTKCCSKQHK